MTSREFDSLSQIRFMTRSHGKPIRIATAHDEPRLSRGQREFNALIGTIHGKRARLAEWETAIPPYHDKYVSQMMPLQDAIADLEGRLAQCLDAASFDKSLSKVERGLIAELMVELTGGQDAEPDDAERPARHSGSDEARRAPDESAPWQRKSAKQRAREASQQAEAQLANQSIREVYRKLASALHPDRETDPVERARKTGLMQRANQAYATNNLLKLLELQLELEHIDQATIDSLGEDRLRHYNKVLAGQVLDLEQEIQRIEDGFRAQFGLAPSAAVAPGTILRTLARQMAEVQRGIDDLKSDLRACRDIKGLKAWLKELRQQRRLIESEDRQF